MPSYAISNVPRRVVYAASGTGPYNFNFEIIAATDVAVYRDDTLLTLTTDYTVTINANGTGYITLTASPTGATQIAIVGSRAIQRTSDFVTGGDFFANTVNDELDSLTIFAQQNAEGVNRALQAPQTDPTSINMTLPRASVRANKTLAFDASGNPTTGEVVGDNRGNWAAGIAYRKRDIVKDTTNGNVYYANTAHTSSGSLPISTNADSTKWDLLVDNASAGASATAAASSASAAATSASNAASSASAASTSASNAASSASTASTQASNASTSATNASNSASAASASAAAAAASYDSFDDRYLGSKASDPTVDNDGNTLLDGALYWDTTNNILKVYDLGATTWRRTTPTSSDQSNINTVSGISADVTTVAGIAANVTTVAGISANVTSVAGNSTNINTVATNIANVNATGGSIASVNTVAGSIASVNTNATNIANINQNAANITAIQNASTNATNAAASATAAATSATNAAASAAAASAVALGNEPVRPTVRPSLLLDFANSKQLDPRITFTRTTTATYYDGKTVAKAEENLLKYSQEFDTAAGWGVTRGTVTANSVAAPDGTTTADTLTQSTGQTVVAAVFSALTSVAAAQHTYSIYAKPNGKNFIVLREDLQTGTVVDTWFNVSTGVVGTTGSGHTASIASAGNGWYRCVITFTPNAARTNRAWAMCADTDNSLTVVDSGGLYLWGAQLEQRSSVTAYTATTTQPITNYIPTLLTAPAGVARFDHNPTTGESLGLFLEEQRTNLLTYSEQFDNAAWSKQTCTISSNVIISPDGTLTADKVVANSGVFGNLYRANTLTAASHTISVFAKAGEWSWILLGAAPSGNSGVWFNLAAGTIGTQNGGYAGTIIPVGNGWYLCSVTFTATAASWFSIIFPTNSNGAFSTGDGYSGIYIWGAQLETGAFPTSYIPTVAAQVTRNLDSAIMTGTNFSSWYSAGRGTIYVDSRTNITYLVSNQFPYVLQIDDGTANNRFTIIKRVLSVYTDSGYGVQVGGVNQAQFDTNVNDGTLVNAVAYNANDFAFAVGGSIKNTDNLGTVPTVNRLCIGTQTNSSNCLNGTIKKIAYYPARVTNAQLQALTS